MTNVDRRPVKAADASKVHHNKDVPPYSAAQRPNRWLLLTAHRYVGLEVIQVNV